MNDPHTPDIINSNPAGFRPLLLAFGARKMTDATFLPSRQLLPVRSGAAYVIERSGSTARARRSCTSAETAHSSFYSQSGERGRREHWRTVRFPICPARPCSCRMSAFPARPRSRGASRSEARLSRGESTARHDAADGYRLRLRAES